MIIPQATQEFKNTQTNLNLCMTSEQISGPRNPKKDAERAAYLQGGQNHCLYREIKQNYYKTGVSCLRWCDTLCAQGMTCDCVERCKQTPGVLFKK